MADRLLFEVAVEMDRRDMSMLKAAHGEAAILPFGGTVSGEVFSGRVLPGGADVQTVDASGVRHMCARYMLEGEDFTGAKCRVYIENNGWFSGGTPTMQFRTIPTFLTDSEALAPLLHAGRFRGEGHPREGGVLIKLFRLE
ncbi:MAG: DUF3237 domain-containing protein [Oscillospiraceae bacterium]|nr:DUF3237 domain-containing protein [Oscillospiraceae bacterium]